MNRIGIDLGGTKTEGVVLDQSGRVLARKRVPTPAADGYAQILKTIHDVVAHLEVETGAPCTVGIGTPGALSTRTHTLKNSNTLSLNGKPIKQDLEAILKREIRIENDANCFVLSEAIDGAASQYRVVFGVIMGTGVGGGIVIDKQLHAGPQHIAGEWGHNILVPDGRRCYCRRAGCVEAYLSGPGLAGQWREQNAGGACLSPEQIVERARQGDRTARSVLDNYLRGFGRALSVVINILDPDAIVIGGGMSNLTELYSQGVQYIAEHVFNEELTTPVLRNRHGDSSGVRGAAQLWTDISVSAP